MYNTRMQLKKSHVWCQIFNKYKLSKDALDIKDKVHKKT